MKRVSFLAALALIVAVFFGNSLAGFAWSLIDQIERLPGQMVGWTGTKNVPVRVSDNGEIFSDASIMGTVNVKANIATGTVTMFRSLATFTAPCLIEWSVPAGEIWIGDATTTVNLVQIHKCSAGYQKVIKVGTSTYNFGIIANSAVSSFAASIHKQY